MSKDAYVYSDNDYMTCGGGGAQAELVVALFRYQGRVLVAVSTAGEGDRSFDLLRYEQGHWKNVTRALIPGFSTKKWYEIPRQGTTMSVFALTGDADYPDIGKQLYDLTWREGKFVVRHK